MKYLAPLIFLTLFATIWSLAAVIIARVSGWAALAARYRMRKPGADEPYRSSWLCSGQVGGIRYNSCLILRVSERGLRNRHSVSAIQRSSFLGISATDLFVEKHFFSTWLSLEVGKPVITWLTLPLWVHDYLPQDIENFRRHPAQINDR